MEGERPSYGAMRRSRGEGRSNYSIDKKDGGRETQLWDHESKRRRKDDQATALMRRTEGEKPSYGAMRQSRGEGRSNYSLDKKDGGRETELWGHATKQRRRTFKLQH
jgi:hypothetical protein